MPSASLLLPLVCVDFDSKLCRRKQRRSGEQRGNASRGEHVVAGDKDTERSRRGDYPAERRLELVRRDHVEVERGGAGPEAAPPAREEARAGGGAGAAEAGEDLEQEVVGKGTDVVRVVGAAPKPGAAAEKPHAAAGRTQLVFAALAAGTQRGHIRPDWAQRSDRKKIRRPPPARKD